ncbi:MAG: sulfotransferase family protein [Promethearchaeota archaeon]
MNMISELNQQQPILICGMHRSGTSLITQMLFSCGLFLGDESDLMKAHSKDNPTGYWEDNEIVKFSENLITKLQGSWFNPKPFYNPSWLLDIDLEEEQQKAVEILEPIIKPDKIWGWKDPRTTILLPFWKSLFPRLKLIICLRDPVEVAFSLSKRFNGHVDFDQGLILWKDYHEILDRDFRELETIIVHYRTMLFESKKELIRLCNFLNLSPAFDNFEEALSRVDEKYYRSVASMELLVNSGEIPYKLVELYHSFTKHAGENFRLFKEHSDNQENECKKTLGMILRTSTDTFDKNFRLLRSLQNELLEMSNSVTQLNVKVNDYERIIQQLKEETLNRALSKSWRFTRPLRKLRNPHKGQ